ncbi:MAG: GNAT family N-acetyltransferase [Bacillota bacterium]|nr:MAG: GNAT family N-acetyltransferase [Bacillota bacterium]
MIIRDMEEKDYIQKGYVHYQSWIETYTGLMDESFLAKHTLQKCVLLAQKYPENTLVAEVNSQIVGFASYGESRDDSSRGEVVAIYVLKDYQQQGIGKQLMDECLKRLFNYQVIVVWVLHSNMHAISWYQTYGFLLDGHTKQVKVNENYQLDEVRMSFHR